MRIAAIIGEGGASPLVDPRDVSRVLGVQRAFAHRAGRRIARALREIRRYQQSTELIIPKRSFSRVVREVMYTHHSTIFRIQRSALQALQEAAEAYLVAEFKGKNCLLLLKACTK